MAPGVIRGKAEGIDEFVFCRVELAEFVENHGEVATGVGEGWIGLESGVGRDFRWAWRSRSVKNFSRRFSSRRGHRKTAG
jgi:hypothetical protein